MPKILMSQENPGGHKLEELLKKLQDELRGKTDRLEGDDCPVSAVLRRNNGYIVSLLNVAERIQRESMCQLDGLGESLEPS